VRVRPFFSRQFTARGISFIELVLRAFRFASLALKKRKKYCVANKPALDIARALIINIASVQDVLERGWALSHSSTTVRFYFSNFKRRTFRWSTTKKEMKITACIKFLMSDISKWSSIFNSPWEKKPLTILFDVRSASLRENPRTRPSRITGIHSRDRIEMPRNAVLSGSSVVTVVERSRCPAGRNSRLHLRHVGVGTRCMVRRHVNTDLYGFVCSFMFLSFFPLTLRTNKLQNRWSVKWNKKFFSNTGYNKRWGIINSGVEN